MILVWFNNITGTYYTRFYKRFILNDYYVGYKNSYGHEVIQIFILCDNKTYNVKDYYDYSLQSQRINKKKKLSSFLKMLIYKQQEN